MMHNISNRMKLGLSPLFLGLGIVPAQAKLTSPPAVSTSDLSKLSNDQLLDRFQMEEKSDNPDYCLKILPLMNEMIRRGTFDGPLEFKQENAELDCSIKEKRWKDAHVILQAIEKRRGIDFGELGIHLAYLAEDFDHALSRLETIANDDDPADLMKLDSALFWEISRGLLKKDKKERRWKWVSILYASPHFSKLDDDFRSGIASNVIGRQADDGKFENPEKLISQITSPYSIMGKLTDNRYREIWPALESAAGENLKKITSEYAEKSQTVYDADTNDREAFSRAVLALHMAGRFEDAINLAETYDHSTKGMTAMTQDDAWALNTQAYALDALGRSAEAEEIFDKIAGVPLDGGKEDWMINFAINRSILLVGKGHWQKGLEAAEFAESFRGSAFAEMLIRKSKICALVNLDRMEEAKPLTVEIEEKRKDAYSTAAEAMLCAGDPGKAAQFVIEALEDSEYRESMIEQMQSPEFDLSYARSILPSLYENMRNRPDVKAVFDKYGRYIPEQYLPYAGIRRRQIAEGN